MFGSLNPGRSARLTASGQILSGQGQLTGILVASGTPTIKVWDSLTAAGEVVVDTFQAAAATPYPIPRIINTGIFITLAGAGDVTVFYN